jgi:hypothetical protein
MTGLLAWLAVGASALMRPRGRPFGEPYDMFEEE